MGAERRGKGTKVAQNSQCRAPAQLGLERLPRHWKRPIFGSPYPILYDAIGQSMIMVMSRSYRQRRMGLLR
jgi:hypothetical protein